MYLHNLSAGGQRELCCLSKCLEIQDQIALRQPIASILKWIPKLFLSASSKVLPDRIGALVRDIQAQEPIFQATQQNNQPASGVTPHGTQVNPMTRRGGARFQTILHAPMAPGSQGDQGDVDIRATKHSQAMSTRCRMPQIGTLAVQGAEEAGTLCTPATATGSMLPGL